MISTTLLKILVIVMIAGKPDVTELLPREYPAMGNKCGAAADKLFDRRIQKKGVKHSIMCVPALTRAL